MTAKPLYDVTLTEVGTRYVGESPVECVTVHKRDKTAVVIRLLPEQMTALRDQLTARLAAMAAEARRRHDEEFEVLGKDTTACCVRHKRLVRWIPAPGWWIHDDDLPHVPGTVYQDGRAFTLDYHTCSALWDAPSPLVIIRRADGQVIYPDQRELARRAGAGHV